LDTEFDQLRLEVQSADSGQADVKYQASFMILSLGVEKLLGRTVGADLKANRTTKTAHCATKRLVVIHDMND
jgi:hypothetical protein